MSDIQTLTPATGPKCPVCGGQTLLMRKHKAVEAETKIYRCLVCNVQYPVAKPKPADG